MPQFLETRYNQSVSLIMAVFWLFLYVFVNLTSILFLGALAINNITGSLFSLQCFFLFYSHGKIYWELVVKEDLPSSKNILVLSAQAYLPSSFLDFSEKEQQVQQPLQALLLALCCQ